VTNSEMRSHRYRLARASAMSKPAEALPPTQSGCGAGTFTQVDGRDQEADEGSRTVRNTTHPAQPLHSWV
jgi:hypothetical protein